MDQRPVIGKFWPPGDRAGPADLCARRGPRTFGGPRAFGRPRTFGGPHAFGGREKR